MIGELFVTFEFDSAVEAKAAWERTSEQCRDLSVNRWAPAMDPTVGIYVTIMAENPDREEFTKAVALMGPGRAIPTPDRVWQALAGKRARVIAETGGKRRVVRSPAGQLLAEDGQSLGPLRRPQG